jgi:hypothetical protein
MNALLLALLLQGAPGRPVFGADRGVELLASWLTGSFSSAAQAGSTTTYRDVRLHAARIWTERSDGPWIYLEQAPAEKLVEPYGQRVLQIGRRSDGAYESRVFTLPGSPLRFAGAWKDPGKLAGLKPADLTLREGCTVTLRRAEDGSFQGGTIGKGCPSDQAGAAYATSDVLLNADSLVSWDRGFDADGKQVWGATQGAYRFDRER